jgi:hypothetical protein
MSRACASPIADAVLLDAWTGELASAERRRADEHLLECDSCAEQYGRIQALADGVRALVGQGRVAGVLLPSALERLHRDGRRVREYSVAPGGSVRCTIAPDDDVVLSRLGADFRGVSRVDLLTSVDEGPEHRLRDVPFDPHSNELLLVPAIEEVTEGAYVMRMRLVAVEASGERELGAYTFNHRPWPGW